MSRRNSYDAVIVGSGPNGLAAAITLAMAGLSTLVVEGAVSPGGGARSAELTAPGFFHDSCSAVYPMGVASPFFRGLPLGEHGLKWISPELPLAHPLRKNEAVGLYRSPGETARQFGDGANLYMRLLGPLSEQWENLMEDILRPPIHLPRHPFTLGRFGLRALSSAAGLARRHFPGDKAAALFAGLASHGSEALDETGSAAIGLVLGLLGHSVGWPIPSGGAQKLSDAPISLLHSHGGKLETGWRVSTLHELPPSRVTMLDLTARQFRRLVERDLPPAYDRQLAGFRYGPGVFKIDYALNAPIPWLAEECRRAGTIHIGGTFDHIASARRNVLMGEHPARPFVLLAQPTLFDPSRAPAGKHIAWAYCHVPRRSAFDMTMRIESQIERFAPGFRDCVMERHVSMTADLERHNPNLIDGSIDGGATNLWQLVARPVFKPVPYRTPLRGVYLCSSSTPPGGGVHGMCGHNAAVVALGDLKHRGMSQTSAAHDIAAG